MHWLDSISRVFIVCALETDALFFLLFISFFFFFHCSTEFCTLYSSQKTSAFDLKQWLEWSQFAVKHFISEIWPEKRKITEVFGITARHPLRGSRPTNSQAGMMLKHCSEAVCTLPLRAVQPALDQRPTHCIVVNAVSNADSIYSLNKSRSSSSLDIGLGLCILVSLITLL